VAKPEPQNVHRLSAAVFFVGTALVVVLVGGLAAVVTWAFHPHPKPPCQIDCPPPEADTSARSSAAAPLHEEGTFTSSQFRFSVEYPSRWSVLSSGSAGALFQTSHGLIEFVGAAGAASPAQLIAERIGRFDTTRLPDIRALGPVLGAHIGTQQGQGTLYSATLLPSSGGGLGLLVRIGLVVARKDNLTVLATVLLPYDASSGTLSGAGEVDYGLTEFRWPGQ
jgi:hypothetical protein